jgi:hypothetical protein
MGPRMARDNGVPVKRFRTRQILRGWLMTAGFWALALAVAWVMASPSLAGEVAALPESWAEHLDVVKVLITLLFGAGVWFAAQKLNRIDKKFDLIFQWKDQISGQVNTLQGEHNVMKRRCTDPGHVGNRGSGHA